MKSIITKLLMLAAVLSASTNIYAYDFKVDGIYYNIISSSEKTVEVTYRSNNFNSYSGNVVIPEQVSYNNDTYSVTSIGSSAFRDCRGLTSVTIPNSVTSIGDSAFDGCTNLKELIIEDGETILELGYNNYDNTGEGLFYDCPLETVYLGRNISYESGNQRGYSPFYKTPITSLTISNSVTSIGNYLFRGCTGLTSVTIPNSVTSIGNSAFENCSNLTSITIPNSVTSIGNFAFSECSNIKDLVIEDGEKILELGDNGYDGLFYDCPLETVYLGRNLNYDGSYDSGYSPFYETSITTLTIGNTVTSIGDYAFDGCNGLTFVTMGNSVTSIGYKAFNNCSKLTFVTIPSSVTSISGSAFGGCRGLKSVYISNLSDWCEIRFSGDVSNPLYYAHNLYLNGELLTDLTIPDGITEIKDYAFIGCRGLTSVTAYNSVTTIGSSAFGGCSGLTSVTIEVGEETISIEGSAFDSSPIATLNLGRNLSSFAFTENMQDLRNLTISDNVTSLGSYAFSGCKSLETVTIPNSVTSLGNSAFKNCSGLTSLTISESVTTIGESAFENCI